MTTPPCTLLLLALDAPPGPWARLDGMPFLRGLREQAAWGDWEVADQGADPWTGLWAGHCWRELGRAGLFNLPGAWPPPALPGWVVARLESPAQAVQATHPPELARDLADYLAGQVALLKRPAPRPQQRDEAFAHWACLGRLVWEHAHRLLTEARPALAGVGFQGLAEVARLFGDDPARVELLAAQVDYYIGRLAEVLAPRAIVCLAGQAGFLAWAPGLVAPGQVAGARPRDLASLALRIFGLKAPPDLAGAWPPGPEESPRHA